MTRKHFEAMAVCISNIQDDERREVIAYWAAGFCASQNPQFNQAIFLSWCGVKS